MRVHHTTAIAAAVSEMTPTATKIGRGKCQTGEQRDQKSVVHHPGSAEPARCRLRHTRSEGHGEADDVQQDNYRT